MNKLAERALRRIGTEGLIDGRPAKGPLVKRSADGDEDVQIVVHDWTVPEGLGFVGAKVVIGGEDFVVSMLVGTGELGTTWRMTRAKGEDRA